MERVSDNKAVNERNKNYLRVQKYFRIVSQHFRLKAQIYMATPPRNPTGEVPHCRIKCKQAPLQLFKRSRNHIKIEDAAFEKEFCPLRDFLPYSCILNKAVVILFVYSMVLDSDTY